jgi:DNA integrity scanning protein DisA with diadenylate cyclase activity
MNLRLIKSKRAALMLKNVEIPWATYISFVGYDLKLSQISVVLVDSIQCNHFKAVVMFSHSIGC